MHWIIQENLNREQGWDALVDFLGRMDIPYSLHKVIPFIGELEPQPAPRCRQVIAMGSYSLRHAAKRYAWYPGVFDLQEQTFERQREHWGEHMLNFDSHVCEFQHVDFGSEPELFLRPIHDSKVIAGGVFSAEKVRELQRNVAGQFHEPGSSNALCADTVVQVCPTKKIAAEYRYWIVDGRIATSSLYKRGHRVIYQGEAEIDPRIDIYAAARAAEWQPARAFVLDVCETSLGLRIVEINTLNAAGFYAANLPRLVMALENAFPE